MGPVRWGRSEGEVGLDLPEVVASQRQVRLLPVENQVEKEALLVTGVPEQPDQMLLLVQRDENVLDVIVQAK